MREDVNIELSFSREKHARWAKHVAEEMIIVDYYRYDETVVEQVRSDALYLKYLLSRENVRRINLLDEKPYCALSGLSRERTKIILENCADVQTWMNIRHGEEFFMQLCFAYSLRFPQVSYTASCSAENTVSGYLEMTRMEYNGKEMVFRQLSGMIPEVRHESWDKARQTKWRSDGEEFLLIEEI